MIDPHEYEKRLWEQMIAAGREQAIAARKPAAVFGTIAGGMLVKVFANGEWWAFCLTLAFWTGVAYVAFYGEEKHG